MSGRYNSQMGNNTSKGQIIPGTFQYQQHERDGAYDSEESNTSSLVAEAGGYNLPANPPPNQSTVPQSEAPVSPYGTHEEVAKIAEQTAERLVTRGRPQQNSSGGFPPRTSQNHIPGFMDKTTSDTVVNSQTSAAALQNDPRTLRGFFAPKPHPKSTIRLNSADILDLWRKIEASKNEYDSRSPFTILESLETLKHGVVSKETVEATPIMARLQELQDFPDNDIKEKAVEVLTRLRGLPRPRTLGIQTDDSPANRWATSGQAENQQPVRQNVFARPEKLAIAGQKPMSQIPFSNTPQFNFGPTPTTSRYPLSPFRTPNGTSPSLTSATKTINAGGPVFGSPNWSIGSSTSNTKAPNLFNTNLAADSFTRNTPSSQKDNEIPIVSESPKPQAEQPRAADTVVFSGPPPARNLFGQNNNPPAMMPFKSQDSSLIRISAPDQRESRSKGPTPTAETMPTIITPEDLLKWARTILNLNELDMASMKEDLRVLHGSVASLTVKITQIMMIAPRLEAAIEAKELEITEFANEVSKNATDVGASITAEEAQTQQTTELRSQIMSLRTALKDIDVGTMKSDIFKKVFAPLQTFSRINNSTWQQKLDAKNKYNSELRTKILSLDQDLTAVRRDLTTAQNDLVGAQITRQTQHKQDSDEIQSLRTGIMAKISQLDQQEGIIQNKYREKMNEKLSEVKKEKDAEVRDLKNKYEAQIGDAQVKSLQYGKATARIEELERQIENMEREKTNMTMAKAAVEKSVRDLEAQITQWKSYEDAYEQIKQEYAELQGACNDAVTERDELKEEVRALKAAGKATIHDEPRSTAPRVPHTVTHRLDDEHKRGVEDYWKKEVKSKMASVDKKRSEIAWHDSEIANLRPHTQPTSQPTQRSSVPAPSDTNTTAMEPLDVGADPLIEEEDTDSEIDIHPGRINPPAVPQSTPTRSRTWASTAAGRVASPRNTPLPPAQTTRPRATSERHVEREVRVNPPRHEEVEWQEVPTRRNGRGKSQRT